MRRLFLLCASPFLLVLGCAAPIQNASRIGYVSTSFGPQLLQGGGLALLPVVAGQGQEGYRRPLGDRLTHYCAEHFGSGRLLGWQETMELLNECDLAGQYEHLITTYRQTAIIRKETIESLGSALGVRYLLYTSLEEFHKEKSTEYSFWSGWQTKKTAGVEAFCQIWDANTGDVVWEGKAAARSEGGELTYEKPYEVYADVAAAGLVSILFRTQVEPQLGGKSNRK